MKTLFVCAFLITVATLALGGSFKSTFIGAGNSHGPIHVADNEFMLIRNFTQEAGGTPRGYVRYQRGDGQDLKVLTASIADPAAPQGSEEVINSIIIAGPASVRFFCGDANCFATFKIDSN